MARIHSVSLQSKVTPFADAEEQSALVATSAKVDNFASQITQELTPVNAKLNLVSEDLILNADRLTEIENRPLGMKATLIYSISGTSGTSGFTTTITGANEKTVFLVIDTDKGDENAQAFWISVRPIEATEMAKAFLMNDCSASGNYTWDRTRKITITSGGGNFANYKIVVENAHGWNDFMDTSAWVSTNPSGVIPRRIWRIDLL